MPPFIAVAIAGVGLYAGLKWLTRELQRTASERAAAESSGGERGASTSEASRSSPNGSPKDLGTLEWDPATGVYKPRKETA